MKSSTRTPLPQALVHEFHPTKNGNLTPDEVTAYSSKKLWWLGECGHEWQAVVTNRTKQGSGCVYCAGKAVLVGFNDLPTVSPQTAVYWHPTKNDDLTPQQVTNKSGKKVWWQCEKGHEWNRQVSTQTETVAACPFCNNRQILAGYNDLPTMNPELAAQFHPTKNDGLTVNDIAAFTNKNVWWLCENCGHEWKAYPANRVTAGSGCRVCSRKTGAATRRVNRAASGVKLLSGNSELMAEWDYSNNPGVNPKSLTPGSNYRAAWKCDKGHRWSTAVYERATRGTRCPECQAKNFVSLPEQEIAQFLQNSGIVVATSERSILKGFEIDLYLPEHKVGIEFNGLYWHSDRFKPEQAQERHHKKWVAAAEQGIQLIQLWEDDWKKNPSLIKDMLSRKLNISQQKTVFARKTQIEELATAEARTFLETNHIQGFASGSKYVGLTSQAELVGVMVLRKEKNNTFNIIRYATACNLPGGFSKLISYAETNYKPSAFITFADHCISNGGLYIKNGFAIDRIIPPDYMYVINNKRQHKFGYRLKRFRNDPELAFEEGLTETQLAKLNGLSRIWDAGKTRYRKTVN